MVPVTVAPARKPLAYSTASHLVLPIQSHNTKHSSIWGLSAESCASEVSVSGRVLVLGFGLLGELHSGIIWGNQKLIEA